jgi:hypothetical protein
MNQALYAHMNNKRKMKKKMNNKRKMTKKKDKILKKKKKRKKIPILPQTYQYAYC